MGDLFWLSDEAWAAIEPQLPKNQPGARRVDDRRVISGIVHVLKSGCRWRMLARRKAPIRRRHAGLLAVAERNASEVESGIDLAGMG